jgi:hypothetical protein
MRGINTFLKGILTEEQEEALKNKVKVFIADAKSDYKPSEEDVYKEAKDRGMYRYLNESKGGAAFNEGGMPTQMQMAFMDDGGLKDEGGEVDPESGNDVPSGSLKKEVRDDMPTMLSEGEFVFPADVVRYIGLEKLMVMRQEAKQGLKTMEAMGQMGNAEDATVPDDLPFGMADLIVIAGGAEEKENKDKPQEMQTGGMSTQLRQLGTQQPVPMRTTNRNIQMPTVNLVNPDGTTGTSPSVTAAQNILNPQVQQPAAAQPAQLQDPRDSVGGVQGFDPRPDTMGIAKPFNEYKGTDFADNAQSYENFVGKFLSYTPLTTIANMSYNSGKKVATDALVAGKYKDGKPLTDFDKIALAKYLTVERPTNSILESLGTFLNKTFTGVDEDLQEEDSTERDRINTLLMEAKAGITLLENNRVKIGTKTYTQDELNEAIEKLRPKKQPLVTQDYINPTTGEKEGVTQIGQIFENSGFVNYNGSRITYMGDVGGTGTPSMDIFKVIGPDGKEKIIRRYEIENAGVNTTGLNSTNNVLNYLAGIKNPQGDIDNLNSKIAEVSGAIDKIVRTPEEEQLIQGMQNIPSGQKSNFVNPYSVTDSFLPKPPTQEEKQLMEGMQNIPSGEVSPTITKEASPEAETGSGFNLGDISLLRAYNTYKKGIGNLFTPVKEDSPKVKTESPIVDSPFATSQFKLGLSQGPQGPEGLLPSMSPEAERVNRYLTDAPGVNLVKGPAADSNNPTAKENKTTYDAGPVITQPNKNLGKIFTPDELSNIVDEKKKEQQTKTGQLTGKGYVGGKGFKAGGLAKMKTKSTAKKRKGGLASQK